MTNKLLQLGFLASHTGSSMRAIVGAIEAGDLAARATLVVSNRRDAAAISFARDHGISTLCIPTRRHPDAADTRLARCLTEVGVELVVLSGYLRKLGPKTLKAYRNRILNIHPALLPRHGGQGMYGRRVHEAVIRSGDRHTGATVHLVDDEYDHGPIVAQVKLAIEPGDTAETIEARVMRAEPSLFVETLQRLARGELALPSGRV